MLYMSTFSSSLTSILLSFLLSNLSNAFKSDDDYNRTCPPLHCGDIKEITYPFSTITNDPPCGFYTIKCNQSTPTIQINETGRSYTVKNISYAEDQITIQDHQLYERLKAKECNFLYKFETPKLPFISIEIITPEITFLNCKTNHDRSQSGLKIFRYTGCRDSYLYYIPQPNSLPTQSFLPECSVFNFPVSKLPAPSDQNWTDDTLLSLLNEGFTLRWDVSAECARCHFERGHCRTENSTGKFWCCFEDCMVANSSGGWDKKKKIAVGVGTGGGSLLLAALLSIVYYHCRKCSSSSSSTLLSRTIAFDQSSSLDLEDSGTIFPTHIFTYKELQEATNNFDPSKILGDGGFGTVYHGKLRDGRFVAVKRLYENNCKRAEQFINEVKILSRLRHQHLISLYGCTSRYRHELLLVYEFIPNGTVADHIHGHRANTLPWPIRLNIAIETADAIAYLHAIEPQIIHRDVKTNNILLDNNFHVKVADFGLSRLFPTDVTHVSTTPQGTPGYVDPEYHQCYQLTEKSDVYSFGVVLIELISSKPAVDVKRHQHEINLSSLAIRKIHNHALHELVDPCLGFESNGGVRKMITLVAELAFMCLQMEKDMRPSMEEVLEVLRGIEKEGYVEEKTNGVDSDDIGLLNISSSPVSVANKWVSRSTTPSNSA